MRLRRDFPLDLTTAVVGELDKEVLDWMLSEYDSLHGGLPQYLLVNERQMRELDADGLKVEPKQRRVQLPSGATTNAMVAVASYMGIEVRLRPGRF